jgi:hypothetical protein
MNFRLFFSACVSWEPCSFVYYSEFVGMKQMDSSEIKVCTIFLFYYYTSLLYIAIIILKSITLYLNNLKPHFFGGNILKIYLDFIWLCVSIIIIII